MAAQEVLDQHELARTRSLGVFWRGALVFFCVIAIALAVTSAFNISTGVTLLPNTFLYLLIAVLFAPAFLLYPVKRGATGKWLFIVDVVLFLVMFSMSLYLATKGMDILQGGWGFRAPELPSYFSVVLWILILEISRRTTGLVFTGFMAVVSLYPTFAGRLPGLLEGHQVSFMQTAIFHIMGNDGVLGIPFTMLGQLIIGYILFGAVVMYTGGGQFFLNLAFGFLGSRRGGPAKVAVVASALFGSISGSSTANVITTGSFTIPTMKSIGFESRVAGAVEACASTGGILMPPVMGATAFVMAGFLGIPYSQVALAAAVPSILYYMCLLINVDTYSVMRGLGGMPKEKTPPIGKTLMDGWPFIACFIVLVYVLMVLGQEYWAPYYSILVLIAGLMSRKSSRLTVKTTLVLLEKVWPSLAELSIMLGTVGFAIGALALTGLANSIARELVALAGNSIPLILIFGALASFILGMGMTSTACYVFVVITIAPALIAFGLEPMGIHMFILYWGVLSGITPPVALNAMAAAPIAKESALKIGVTATTMAAIIYLLPFFFVINPAILLHGSLPDIVSSIALVALGALLINAGFSNYLYFVGRLKYKYRTGLLIRLALVAGGIAMSLPYLEWRIAGLTLAAATVLSLLVLARSKSASLSTHHLGG